MAFARLSMDQRKTQLDTLAIVLLLACSALWGLGQVAAKVGLREMPPLWQAGVRSLGAALPLLLWSRLRGLPVLQADGTGRAGLLAGALFAAEFACIFGGLQYTSASRMAVFIYLAPFVVALGMPLISRHERLRPWQVLGLLLAFAGVVWAFAEGFTRPASGPRQWLGDAMGIAAALLWGLTTLVLRASRLSTAAPEKTLLYQLAVSGVALCAASWAAGEPWPSQLGALSLGVLAFQVLVISFASYLVWFWLMRHYPATRISAFVLLTPVFGLLAGVALLGEPMTARLVVALVAVCAGIALVNRATPAPAAQGAADSNSRRSNT
jgi:drug/metabolite transporter (DMT)-like permease